MVMKGVRRVALVLVALGALAVLAGQAVAEERHHHEEIHHHHNFHGRDVRLFEPFELHLWRGGRWHEGWHDGRLGWWWVTGGAWYYYERPIYPYPYVVSEVIVPEPMVPPPPPGYAPPPPVSAPPPPPPVQPQVWYYCDNPAGYYPYVPSCPTPFRVVPAQPR
jgi:hypothetical protein